MAEQQVWQALLDQRWQCRVVRTGPRSGHLTVGLPGQPPVLQQDVTLDYGAVFGPDVADVERWQQAAAQAVDQQ